MEKSQQGKGGFPGATYAQECARDERKILGHYKKGRVSPDGY